MKLPATIAWECIVEGCPTVLDLPASWMDSKSDDPRYAGFLLVIEKQAAIDHLKQAHGVD